MKGLQALYQGLGIIMPKYDHPHSKQFRCDYYDGVILPATDYKLSTTEVEKLLDLGWIQPLMDFHDEGGNLLLLTEVARKHYRVGQYWVFCQ